MGLEDEVAACLADLKGKCKVDEPNEELLTAVVRGLGPAAFKADAKLVSSSDPEEVKTVKKNFLEGKLGLADGPELDTAIEQVVETYGKSNAHKLRGVVYYLLTAHFKKYSVYGIEVPEPSPKKAKTGPTATEKEVEACLKDLKEKCGIADPDEALLLKVIKGLGPAAFKADAKLVASADPEEVKIVKKNFLEGKLGLAEGPELDKAIEEVVETYGKSNAHKLRGVVYYLLTKKFDKASVYD